jgi:hypothetical protein
MEIGLSILHAAAAQLEATWQRLLQLDEINTNHYWLNPLAETISRKVLLPA